MEIEKKTNELISMIKSFQKSNDIAIHDYKQLTTLFKDSAFRLYTEKSHQAIAVYNFLEGRYEYISDTVTLYCPTFDSKNPEAGPDLFIAMMKPSSIEVMIHKITPRMLGTCQEYRSSINDIRFTACVQINPTSSNIDWILMSSYMLSATPEGFPILSLTMVADITSIKKDSFIHYGAHQIKGNQCQVIYYETEGSDRSATISKREVEVLQLIGKGQTTKEIAEALFVSFETVKKHRSNILEKMNCSNTVELLNKATMMGIV